MPLIRGEEQQDYAMEQQNYATAATASSRESHRAFRLSFSLVLNTFNTFLQPLPFAKFPAAVGKQIISFI